MKRTVKRFTVDLHSVRSFGDFVTAFDAGFTRHVGFRWNGSLDAFHDLLSWPDEPEYELAFIGATSCAEHLGHGAMATWLRETLDMCHPLSVASVRSRLAQAEEGNGQTLFELILEIVAENPHVKLLLQ